MPSRLLFVVALLVAACTGGTVVEEPGNGTEASTPTEAVELLIEYFEVPDFDAAAQLSYPRHAALAALAEGASFAEVAAALRTDDLAVAANFWAGFAQGAGSFLTPEVQITGEQFLTHDGVEFGVVNIDSPSLGERSILTRQAEGHRVDLFASFGPGLASPMIPTVERLLAAQTEDAALILDELNGVVPSLVLASRQPWVPPAVALDVIRLIELITRPG